MTTWNFKRISNRESILVDPYCIKGFTRLVRHHQDVFGATTCSQYEYKRVIFVIQRYIVVKVTTEKLGLMIVKRNFKFTFLVTLDSRANWV